MSNLLPIAGRPGSTVGPLAADVIDAGLATLALPGLGLSGIGLAMRRPRRL